MLATVTKILPAVVIFFWASRIFFRKDVRDMQMLMVMGMLMTLMTLFAGRDTALFMLPFFFLAVHGMTSGSGISKWQWLVLLPSVLFIPFRETSAFTFFLLFQTVSLTLWSAVKVKRFNDLLSEYYDRGSDIGEDLSQMVMYLSAIVVVDIVLAILPDDVISIPWIAVSFSLFISVLQYLMGKTVYYMDDIPKIAGEMAVPDTTSSGVRPEVRTLTANADDRLLQRVISEQLYLNPSVSLVSLADELHTNRTYLSNSIHSCYNQNFSDFINTLRIRYALELMKAEGRNVNIKDVAQKSGYNHIQSFYRNFAIIMEMTPKTWLDGQLHRQSK